MVSIAQLANGADRGSQMEPVRVAYELDDGPGRHRIGLITLASDQAAERDFRMMLPNDDIAVFATRVPNASPWTVENLRAAAPRLAEATSLLLPESRLDVIAYVCTSGTAALGFQAVAQQIRSVRPGIACSTPLTAAVAALRSFGLTRIALLTTYLEEINRPVLRFLENQGMTVLALSSFNLADSNDMARVPSWAIHDAALEIDAAGVEAIFISGTAIRAVEVIEPLEQRLRKPVITSNQVLFWQALRYSGYHTPVPGFGRLLRL